MHRTAPPLSSPPGTAARGAPASGLHTSSFGMTGFDQLATETLGRLQPRSAFDVCQPGVALRAVLLVHGAVALGVAFAATGWREWLALLAVGSAAALPGVLLWLVSACLLRGALASLPAPGQWAAAIGLGAVCGAAGAGVRMLAAAEASSAGALLPPAATGAAMAAALFYWLRLRASARVPADATARLAELQSRIRPHFLFNTLNTAIALVRHDPGRAEDVLEDLSELFRVALEGGGQAATLADEVALAQRYLAIEQVRFGERLQVAWDLDHQADKAPMPALLLQPLVENAVRHGIEPAGEGGVIRVRSRVRGGHAELTIANSVPPAPSRPGNGIALRNVRERLALMHDMSAQFDARRDGPVFRVRIVVPLAAQVAR